MILTDLSDSGWRSTAGSCEHDQETVGSLKRGDFIDFFANCMFIRTLVHGDGLDKVNIMSRIYLDIQEVLVITLNVNYEINIHQIYYERLIYYINCLVLRLYKIAVI
jgi:hypothetical protein